MTHTAIRKDFEELIDQYAPVGQVGTGFTFTEGPIWHPRDHYLLFSDMPADVRRRWDARSGTREVMRPSNKCNGMTYDADLNLIVCEHATSSLIRERPDGRREVIASHYQGMELNSPNDAVVHSDGSIYFSDPWYGRMPVYGVERPRVLGFQGVYRVPPGGGAPQLVVDRDVFDQPNGLCFSPDEKKLYINDTVQANIRVFDVKPDGTLANRMLFAGGIKSDREPGVPDGMKCDSRGNVWVTGPGGVWVYAPGGELIGKVRIPERAANLAWGGPDFQTLFVCATHSVYSVKTKVTPRMEPFMRARSARRQRGRVVRAAAATLFAAATSAAGCRAGSDPHGAASRSVALRADHPGHAERRGDGGRRVRGVGLARALPPTERDREYPPARRCLPRARRAGDPCLVPGRAGRARRDHERALVRGAARNQRHGARQLGLGAGRGARAQGRRSCGREGPHERLGRHAARNHPENACAATW